MSPQPFYRHPAVLMLVSLATIGLSTAFSAQPMRLSGWRGSELSATFSPVAGAATTPDSSETAAAENTILSGQARIVEPAAAENTILSGQPGVVEPSAAPAPDASEPAAAENTILSGQPGVVEHGG